MPNSDFTGSLAKFWFQVHNLHLLKIRSPGTGKQHHSRNSELKNSDRVQMCVLLDPSNAAFPLGDYWLLLVPLNHWVLGPQLYTHWHLASTSLLTLTIRRAIHPNIQSQSSRPWISGYPAPSPETVTKRPYHWLLPMEAFCLHNKLEMAIWKGIEYSVFIVLLYSVCSKGRINSRDHKHYFEWLTSLISKTWKTGKCYTSCK